MSVDYRAVSGMRTSLSGLQKEDRNLSTRIEKIERRAQSSQE